MGYCRGHQQFLTLLWQLQDKLTASIWRLPYTLIRLIKDYFETSLSLLHNYHKTNSDYFKCKTTSKLIQNYKKTTSKRLQTVIQRLHQNFLNRTSRLLQGYTKTDSRTFQRASRTIKDCFKTTLELIQTTLDSLKTQKL